MSATNKGGIRAAATNKKLYGNDFYERIGALGGSRGAVDGVIKGFAADPKRASKAGRIGGQISKRRKAL